MSEETINQSDKEPEAVLLNKLAELERWTRVNTPKSATGERDANFEAVAGKLIELQRRVRLREDPALYQAADGKATSRFINFVGEMRDCIAELARDLTTAKASAMHAENGVGVDNRLDTEMMRLGVGAVDSAQTEVARTSWRIETMAYELGLQIDPEQTQPAMAEKGSENS